jgi:hypothetical protein
MVFVKTATVELAPENSIKDQAEYQGRIGYYGRFFNFSGELVVFSSFYELKPRLKLSNSQAQLAPKARLDILLLINIKHPLKASHTQCILDVYVRQVYVGIPQDF